MDACSSTDVCLFGEYQLDRRNGVLFRKDERGVFAALAVGARALEILGVLIERPGEVISRAEIMAAVWPQTVVEDSNLNVQIAALRRILDVGRANGSCIQTIPGRGYRFVVPVTRAELPTPLSSGAAGSVEGRPHARYPAAPRRPRIKPHNARTILHASLAIVAGALSLFALVSAASNSYRPQPGVAGSQQRVSIVVLPFVDLSDDRDGRNLADALTEDLTTDLSALTGVRVVSRNTAFTYRGRPAGTKQIGDELQVRYVLEGSVRRSANLLHVNAQLVDAETDAQLWAERLVRETDNPSASQSDITSRIANTVGFELIAAEAARSVERPDALEYILRARATHLRPDSRDVFAEAISLLDHALALDPHSIQAQTILARSLIGRVLNRMSDSVPADLARADGLVGQVLATSPRSMQAHFIKGQLLRAQERWQEAAAEFERMLEIDPNSTDALHALSWCKLVSGAIEEVIPLEEKAIRLSPHYPNIGFRFVRIGLAHLLQSRPDDAIPWLEKAASGVPEFFLSHSGLTAAYALKGETARAAAELAELRKVASDDFSSIAQIRARIVGVPKAKAMYEDTYLAGLHMAGVPDE
jgi:adenylate cyclase